MRTLAAIAFAFAAGCASVHTSSAAPAHTQVLVPAPPPTPTPFHATPIWRYQLPAGWDEFSIRAQAGTVVAGGRGASVALDTATGKRLWHLDSAISRIALGNSLAYGTPQGAIALRSSRSGTLIWQTAHVCRVAAPPYAAPIGPIGIIVRHGNDLLVGCDGGTVVRMDANSGEILARKPVLLVNRIDAIRPLGACSFGVTGWGDGATLVFQMSIVDCKELRTIVPPREDTTILGALGNTAILDDTCCFGRPDVYRPATIVRANLMTGELSPPVDLTPEPSLYPARSRPLGQGSVAFLAGNDLYLAVDHALYDYGDARGTLAQAKRLNIRLTQPPAVIGDGLIALTASTGNGPALEEIARVDNGVLHTIWSTKAVTLMGPGGILPDVPGVIMMPWRYVRTTQPAELVFPRNCQMAATDAHFAIGLCSTKKLVDGRYLQYLAGFRWVSPATSHGGGGL